MITKKAKDDNARGTGDERQEENGRKKGKERDRKQ